jgi:hypothetical protein
MWKIILGKKQSIMMVETISDVVFLNGITTVDLYLKDIRLILVNDLQHVF